MSLSETRELSMLQNIALLCCRPLETIIHLNKFWMSLILVLRVDLDPFFIFFYFLVFKERLLIGHVRYIKIQAWLRGFRVKIANF